MNKDIMKACGFEEEAMLASIGICPFCHVVVGKDSFRDDLSKREFEISGLCQKCQDEFFNGGNFNEDDEEDEPAF